MICPRCKSLEKTKNGIIKGIQRYKCKSCNYNFTVEIKSARYCEAFKKKALVLYLEGLGFRAIGRILGVSNVSILNWIRAFGEEIPLLQRDPQEVKIAELDEMHSYVGSKKTTVGFG